MLHEYAVEPELVATWCDRASGRYFLDKFGLGSPRIMSRYPRKHWKRLVWEAWKNSSHDDSERKRMEELIQRLSEDMVTRRNAVWNPDGTWFGNVLDEHRRIPFHAILVRSNARAHPNILVADEVDERTALWSMPHETVPRTPKRLLELSATCCEWRSISSSSIPISVHSHATQRSWRPVSASALSSGLAAGVPKYDFLRPPTRLALVSTSRMSAAAGCRTCSRRGNE